MQVLIIQKYIPKTLGINMVYTADMFVQVGNDVSDQINLTTSVRDLGYVDSQNSKVGRLIAQA